MAIDFQQSYQDIQWGKNSFFFVSTDTAETTEYTQVKE